MAVWLVLEKWLVLETIIEAALAAAGDSIGGLRLTKGIVKGVAW
jgi:hypothetical protein